MKLSITELRLTASLIITAVNRLKEKELEAIDTPHETMYYSLISESWTLYRKVTAEIDRIETSEKEN